MVLSEKEFSEENNEGLLDSSPSLVRADTDRLKLLESVHEDENLIKDMGKRDALVKKKTLEVEPDEAQVEVKSYDSEDSLDGIEIEVAAPKAEVVEKGTAEPALKKQATK